MQNASADAGNMPKLQGFDGSRAIACLWVIVFHLFQKLDPRLLPAAVQEVHSAVLLGNIGVSIFFVLSGTLLSYPFWENWLAGAGPPSLRAYAIKRLARIAPGFYLSMLVSLVLSVAVFGNALNAQLLVRFGAGLAFVSGFHWLTFFPVEVNGPLWSIGFEVFAYVLLAVFMTAMFRPAGARNLMTGIVFWLAIGALSVAIHLVIVNHVVPSETGRGWQFGMVGGAKSWMPWYNPVGMFNHFLLGILAAGLLCHMRRIGLKRQWRFDVVVLLVWLSMGMYLWSYRHIYTGFDGSLGNIYFWPWFPLAISVSLCLLPFTHILGETLDNPVLRYVARISFGLYIWHALIIELLHVTLFPDFYYMGTKALGAWITPAFISLALSVAVAALSYRYVERPALRWGHELAATAPKYSVPEPRYLPTES
jgi:peptidoglycan/LPS O-acetylase OafA/YrhL